MFLVSFVAIGCEFDECCTALCLHQLTISWDSSVGTGACSGSIGYTDSQGLKRTIWPDCTGSGSYNCTCGSGAFSISRIEKLPARLDLDLTFTGGGAWKGSLTPTYHVIDYCCQDCQRGTA